VASRLENGLVCILGYKPLAVLILDLGLEGLVIANVNELDKSHAAQWKTTEPSI
jgi:hypothetical protein